LLKLLLATNNQGKVREFQALLNGCGVELITPAQAGLKLDVHESGSTYEENARLKAVSFASASGLLTLADDSGLEVDALNGEPGLRSARYAGDGASDTQRVNFLLEKLKGVPPEKRSAHFRCVIALAQASGKVQFYSGHCDGIIIPEGPTDLVMTPFFSSLSLKKPWPNCLRGPKTPSATGLEQP
jgi:XTP/dITP diphosphohydrolase